MVADAYAQPRRERARRLLRIGVAVLLALLLLLIATSAVAAFDAARAVQEIQAAQQDLGGALHGGALLSVTGAQVARDGARLGDAATRLKRDRTALQPAIFLLHGAGWLPYVGRPADEAGTMLDLAQQIAAGGAAVTRGVEPLLAEVDTPADQTAATVPPAQRLMRALSTGSANLRAGDLSLNRAMRLRGALHPAAYRGPFSALRNRLALLDADLPRALQTADALALLPDAVQSLFGFAGPRTYVVLGQDSAEIRATGGFLGSAGLLTFDQGKIVFQEYRSSYDYDPLGVAPLPAPPSFSRFTLACCWYMRDANWSPDFPTAARAVLDFVQRGTGVRADGVLAFDNDAVTDLLQVLGPLQVSGFPTAVTAANWFDLTTQTLYTAPGSLTRQVGGLSQQAKSIGLGALLQPVLARVQSVHGDELKQLVDALRSAVVGNHLQIAVVDQQPAAWAHAVGADGALFPPAAGDIVAPVESNVGNSKIGPYVQRSGRYEVWLAPDGSADHAALSFAFSNTVDAATLADPSRRIEGTKLDLQQGLFLPDPGYYGNYFRLYVPGGSNLLSTQGTLGFATDQEGGFYVLSGLVPLEAQSQAAVAFGYRPNFPAEAGRYRLTFFKQGGISQVPWQVIIHLPPNTHATTLPPGATIVDDTVSLSTTISSTQTFTLSYAR